MLIGLATGSLVCWWAWKLAGRMGAFAATAAYAMDPNFLGHASLVKNDAPLGAGHDRIDVLTLAVRARGNKTESGGNHRVPLLCDEHQVFRADLFCHRVCRARVRAQMNQSWTVLKWELKERANRWVVPYLVCAAAGVCAFVFIWWCYGFRYSPTHDPNQHFEFVQIASRYQTNILQIFHEGDPKPDYPVAKQAAKIPIPVPIGAIRLLEDYHVLPEAWLHGLYYTYATTVMRGAYLNGMHSLTGWWYFFPLCVLYKTPVGTLSMLAVMLVMVTVIWARRERKPADWLIVASLVLVLIRIIIWSCDMHFPVFSAAMVENVTHSDDFDKEYAARTNGLGTADVAGQIAIAKWAFEAHQYSKAAPLVDVALRTEPDNKDALTLQHLISDRLRPSWFNLVFNLAMLAPLVVRIFPVVIRSGASSDTWLLVCLITPMVLYGGSAMASNFNLGIRHVLPLLPLLHLALGVAAARLLARWGQIGALVIGFLGVSLAIESCAAWPNYISFFNAPSGGQRGGIGKLSDSNLDWGQDLTLLADWHKAHPQKNVYLCYFGMADPTFYGISPRIDLPGGYELSQKQPLPNVPGVIAMSATDLQQTYTYWSPQVRDYFSPLWQYEPREVLGGTIYLFDWPLKAPTTQQ